MRSCSGWVFVVCLIGALSRVAIGEDGGAGITERVSISSEGFQGDDNSTNETFSLSGTGRFVVFPSFATNLVAGDGNDVRDIFVRDRVAGVTERVSVSSASVEADGGSNAVVSISADGRFVTFSSQATNLVTGDTNSSTDVFVRDRQSGATERVSLDSGGSQGNGDSTSPSISADGRFVAFSSSATNLVAGDTNGVEDIFIHDRQTGVTERVSLTSGGLEGSGGDSVNPSISGDGRFVVFASDANTLVDGDANDLRDVFVHDRQAGTTERVSVNDAGDEGTGGGVGNRLSISADGRFVTFSSNATNLVSGDTNARSDVFVRDRSMGATLRISVDSGGQQSNGGSQNPSISSNGQYIVFDSIATNLVVDDLNLRVDVFVHDRLTGVTDRVSVDNAGVEGNGPSRFPSTSGDGRVIAFESEASNLILGDTNGLRDVFVHDRVINTSEGTSVTVSPADVTTGTAPVNVTFSAVTEAGTTSLSTSDGGPTLPGGFALGNPPLFYELTTTAEFTPPVTVCVNYSGVSFQNENELRLFHFEGGAWVDQTSSLETDANVVCASVNSLSPFAVVEQQSAPALTVLAPAQVWLGLKSNAGGNKGEPRFDLLGEVLKNGAVVGSGQIDDIPGGGPGFGNAILQAIPLALAGQTALASGDTFGIRLSIRMGAAGPQRATARLWYNDAGANTRFGATIDSVAKDYFLDGTPPFTLSLTTGSGKKTIDVDLDRAVGGNPFKPFGTWTLTVP